MPFVPLTPSQILLAVLVLAVVGFAAGRMRAIKTAAGDTRVLHSLPAAYGQLVALFTAVPALLVMAAWLLLQPMVIERGTLAQLTQADVPQGSSLSLVMADVRRIADGLETLQNSGVDVANLDSATTNIRDKLATVGIALGADVPAPILKAAQRYHSTSTHGRAALTLATLILALAGMAWSLSRISPQLRARNTSEGFVKALMIAASMVAVLTTIAIIFSLVFETWHFFNLYPAKDFFFSTEWAPKFGGGSALGLWPLVWGTVYVSFIALVVAVPVGLMAAIYLAEYASKPLRAVAKPALEVLAGIPSIVYGLFALITVGPFLRDWIAAPAGLGTSSSSVMTAGLVMGIMLIPYVSSLSDDIINAVPQSLRDGSYGIGATRSETVKQVILPAALPGIVGAVLLAASRAIGETMIVVMGAGASAKLGLNPFEAMTTVTVKIVSQLTGDTEFASPETLVAFALGLTLFFFTLALNVVALVIVRKYREQYE